MRDPVQRNVPTRPGGGGGDAAGSGKPAEQSGATGTMSIGEVLGILKPEFPDITVSKIRFLEGAGLVQPDRSASGYRKFSEDDVARLRFVLRAQRDQYLPLRVIRQRLTDLEQVGGLDTKAGQAGSGAAGAEASAAGSPGAVRLGTEAGPGSGAAGSGATGTGPGAGSSGAGASGNRSPGAGAAEPGGARARAPEASAAGAAGTVKSPGAGGPGSSGAGGAGAGGAAGSAAAVGQPARGTGGGFAAAPPSDAQFTRDELCRAAGANVDQLLELESFGLVSARGSGDRGAWYGGDEIGRASCRERVYHPV